MIVFILVLLFIVGTSLGSFLLCILQRVHSNEPWAFSRSKCDHCLKKIFWYDLVPILSFVLLKGKCRFCKARINWHLPLIELLLGLLFSFSFWYHLVYITSQIHFFGTIFLITILFCIALYDALYQLVLPVVICSGALGGILFHYLHTSLNLKQIGLGILIGVGFFLVQFLFSRGTWIGSGDSLMGLLMGIWLGSPVVLVAILGSYIIGAVYVLPFLCVKKKQLNSKIPLATFLSIGTLVSFFFGQSIINILFF